MQPVSPIVVFCDLDHSLLDPHALAADAAAHRALDLMTRGHIPLVLCSSRTRVELERVQQELGIHEPFICENGAAIFIPRGYFGFDVGPSIDVAGYDVLEFGKPYAKVVSLLHRAADRLGVGVIGFNDMSVGDVARDCGVPLLQARLAKLREYTEPFRLVDASPDALPRLRMALRVAGLDCASRGRYHYVGGLHRGVAGQVLRGLYRQECGEIMTITFGDGRDTSPLVPHADHPFVSPSGTPGEAARRLAAAPAARAGVADSVEAWADVMLEIAGAARRRGGSWSS